MKAIEIKSKTDRQGNLKIDYPVHKSNRKVRVLILLDEEDKLDDEESLWMKSVSHNPAFEYLADESEDIYTVNDGEPLDD
ncbi:hypothetical protein [Anaerophaga thermohalophila]|jgi:hypothetical protein|uniref:hypothetical protein n=1 Tax=Anaerophaga thermohalophila TaxID=177400 RepID=UPI0002DC9572|nr:hypothetical protein [Anaerophaga thermohalophila]